MTKHSDPEIDVVIPNLNARFSGVTSTVLQVVPHQMKELRMATFGYPFPCELPKLGWFDLIRRTRRPRKDGGFYVFHARRNIEMLAGLILKNVFGCRFYLIFTSEAQRKHSRWTGFLGGRMDMLLSTSQRSASFMRHPPHRIIPHGVNIETYAPAPSRDSAWMEGGLPGKRGIGIFGRVRPQKGLREYVEALCEVLPGFPDYTGVIIGQVTPQFNGFVGELKAYIRERGLEHRFCWLGKLPFEEIPGWFRRMSLVVCASRNEGFGLTCLEAMASGVPVAVTRAGAWETIVREGVDGWIADPKDSRGLARAISKMLSDGSRLEDMGRAARDRVAAEFTIQKEASSLTEVYRRAIRHKR
ncbi:MAG: glycosyltransferase family 4 protein [Verrucomicrobia bacterium]|nr:glycosyltransferase family 4 protein [Verrucomicrobiota bacterium]